MPIIRWLLIPRWWGKGWARSICWWSARWGERAFALFYNRVKGEMEEALIAQQWPRLTIARPSMLIGEREKQRTSETLFAPLFRLLPGNLKSIDARDVASALLAEALSPTHEGVQILSSSQLRERAARSGD